MNDRSVILRQYEGEKGSAYLELQDHPHAPVPGILVGRTINVHSLIEDYQGPSIFLDFNHDGVAIGIEIIYPSAEDEEDAEDATSDA